MIKGQEIFIDSDVLLDVILNREPHIYYSRHILALVETNYFDAYTSALILANCHYIIFHHKNKAAADESVILLRSLLTILPLTDREIGESLSSGYKDFEDGLQYYTALNHNLNRIITRNTADYRGNGIKILTPRELVSEL